MQAFFVQTKVISGEETGQVLKTLSQTKIMLFCDPFLQENGVVEKLSSNLKKEGKEVFIFSEIMPDPTVDSVTAALKEALFVTPELFVAMGGGSTLDTAKAVCYFYEKKENVTIPLVAVPTTSGTGSEVTSYAVITDTVAKTKIPLTDSSMRPTIAILDESLLLTMPKSITIDTALDALTHSLEAYVSKNATDFTDALAEKAVAMIFEYLKVAVKDGQNCESRRKLHHASCLAGMAFDGAGLGLNHAMAHQLGGYHHIPHGKSNGVLLPHVVEYNGAASEPAREKYAYLAQLLGKKGATSMLGTKNLVREIIRLKTIVGAEKSIQNKGKEKADYIKSIEIMAKQALQDGCIHTNPALINIEDMMKIYRKCCE